MAHRIVTILLSAWLILSGSGVLFSGPVGSGLPVFATVGLANECCSVGNGSESAACPLCGPDCPCAAPDDRRDPAREPQRIPGGASLSDLWRMLAEARRFEIVSVCVDSATEPAVATVMCEAGPARLRTVGQRLALFCVRTT